MRAPSIFAVIYHRREQRGALSVPFGSERALSSKFHFLADARPFACFCAQEKKWVAIASRDETEPVMIVLYNWPSESGVRRARASHALEAASCREKAT